MFALADRDLFLLPCAISTQWPPPKSDEFPPIYHPLPLLPLATFDLSLLLVSVMPDGHLRLGVPADATSTVVSHHRDDWLLIGIAAIVLRFMEFWSLQFRWDDNAYGSITWTLLGLHLMHLIILTIEDGLMSIWVWVKGLDDKHVRDIRVTARLLVLGRWRVGHPVLRRLLDATMF